MQFVTAGLQVSPPPHRFDVWIGLTGDGTSENHRVTIGNLAISVELPVGDTESAGGVPELRFSRVDTDATLLSAVASFAYGTAIRDDAYLSAQFVTTPGTSTERIYGLGQGNWTDTVKHVL